MNLLGIETLTKRFSEARSLLSVRVADLEEVVDQAKKRRLPGIRKAVAAATEAKAKLQAGIDESAEVFKRPRTRVMHGVKVGFRKGKGKVSWADKDKVVELIERHLPDQAETLIKVKKTPIKEALENLPTADLKKIGVTVKETGDEVVIRPTDSEVDKLVDALLKGAEDEDAEVQEAA